MPINAAADTSFLLALFRRNDAHHSEVNAAYAKMRREILLPSPVLPELAYHINHVGGGRAVADALLRIRQSPLTLTDLEEQDYDRVAAILKQYHDSRIDFVDACIMALAERLNITRILTCDRRDFSLFRPAHVEHFTLLP